MKRFLLAALGALAIVSLNGCCAPYAYTPAYGGGYYGGSAYYGGGAYYGQPAYSSAYVTPAYRPARVYVAPRAAYRTVAVAPRYGRHW